MDWKNVALGLGVIAVGCAKPAPTPPTVATLPPPVLEAPKAIAPKAEPVLALLEPYLVAETVSQLPERSPVPLGGRIIPIEPAAPLTPAPPTTTRPIAPPPESNKPVPTPSKPRPLPPALVKLFEEERSHAVDVATRAVAAATARVTQTTADAKKTWELVRAGALAQFKADQADAAVRSANAEKAEAEKTLADAQERRRNARRDVEAAFAVAVSPSGFALAQKATLPPAYRPVPYTYRLSVLGLSKPTVTVENGSLGRSLSTLKGEAGAWIVRCLDPSRLRVKVGTVEALVVVRPLPSPTPSGA